MVYTHFIHVDCRGYCDIHNVSPELSKAVRESGMKNGTVTVFIGGSTASITTIEYESGAVQDLKDAIQRLAPQEAYYQHNERWHDGNGFSHVRSALMGPSISIPLVEGQLQLGTWQQVILIDFDNKPRKRRVVVQMVGD
jgi:secondary thiamine-phosphate synthase enzyme